MDQIKIDYVRQRANDIYAAKSSRLTELKKPQRDFDRLMKRYTGVIDCAVLIGNSQEALTALRSFENYCVE